MKKASLRKVLNPKEIRFLSRAFEVIESNLDDEEFKIIIKNIEEKYNTEHNRVKEWLAKNEEL